MIALRQFSRILKYMLLLEFRVRDAVTLLLSLSIMFAVIAGFGITSASLEPRVRERLFPALLWLCFMVNAAVALGRSFEYESEHKVLDGLLLAGVPPAVLFFAKATVNILVLCAGQVAGVTVLGMLLGVSLVPHFGLFSAVSLLVIVGYSALATIVAALTAGARLRNVLLPLILLPLLFPLFFCAIELTTLILEQGILPLSSQWLSLLAGLTVVYVALGATLFEFAVGD